MADFIKPVYLRIFRVFLCIWALTVPTWLPGQESGVTTLTQIVEKIDTYKNSRIVMRLKLRNYDRIFERIIFYDNLNHDIDFNVSESDIKKRIKGDMLNLHEGLLYEVTFIVKSAGKLGGVIGELISFKPVILESIPEGESRPVKEDKKAIP